MRTNVMQDGLSYPAFWGWWPLLTLVVVAITVMLVAHLAMWVARYVTSIPVEGRTVCTCQVDKIGMVIKPACVCDDRLNANRIEYVTQPVPHLGVEEWQAHELKPLAPLDEQLKAALLSDTAEWNIVLDETDEQAKFLAVDVVDDNVVDLLVEDELGAWDPNTVDWLEPALYIETVQTAVRMFPSLINDSVKRNLAASFRAQTIMAADAILTGS